MLKQTCMIGTLIAMGTTGVCADINLTEEVKSLAKKYSHVQNYEMLVYVRSGKKSYVVGESIGIEVKLKKNAYMYFWNIPKEGDADLILPNALESYHLYKKNIAYTVPESSARYSFVPASAGVEEMYVIASPKKLTKEEVRHIVKKKISTKLEDKTTNVKKEKKSGIMVLAKKPKYDVVHLKMIVYANKQDTNTSRVVKIGTDPYGSRKGHYPGIINQ